MDFLKGLVLSLLSFLLFLSLSAFGDILMLKRTLLSPAFVVSQVDRLDIALLAEELLSEQIPQQGEELVAEVLSNTAADLEPWMKEQASVLIYSGYDYLLGESDSLSLSVSLEPIEDSLKDNLRQVIFQSLPPELAGASQEMIDQFVNEAYQQVAGDIPETFEFNQSLWGPQIQSTLEQVKQAIGYVEFGYKVLIVFMVLLILGIFLIDRQIRTSIRRLGIIFLSYGAIQYVSIFIVTRLAETQLVQLGLPLALQAWLPQFLSDLFAFLMIFSIGFAVAGVVLIIAGSVPWQRKPKIQQQVSSAWQTFACPGCGSQCTQSQQFCGACGARLASGCPTCGAVVDSSSRFCANCGTRLV